MRESGEYNREKCKVTTALLVPLMLHFRRHLESAMRVGHAASALCNYIQTRFLISQLINFESHQNVLVMK